jgi:hypothetical protein
MIDRQIDSPIPMPCDFVVKNDSNMRSTSFGAIPVPESSTDKSTPSASRIAVLILNTRVRSRYQVHGVGGVPDQVQDNLLQLAFVADYQWGPFG